MKADTNGLYALAQKLDKLDQKALKDILGVQ